MVRVGYARVGLALGLYISYCLCQFHLRCITNANQVLGLIFMGLLWAVSGRMVLLQSGLRRPEKRAHFSKNSQSFSKRTHQKYLPHNSICSQYIKSKLLNFKAKGIRSM